MAAFADCATFDRFHSSTQIAVSRVKAKWHKNHQQSSVGQRWKHAADLARRSRSRTHYQEQLNVCTMEHMSTVDAFNGSSARQGQDTGMRLEADEDEDLLVVSPHIDGRLRDEGRA